MKRLIKICIALTISINTNAQNCFLNGLTLSTQKQIDDFSTNYPKCTTINGFLYISGTDINNLNGLSQLKKIKGRLFIYNTTKLKTLSGLNGIDSIFHRLEIINNHALENLNGLQNLTYIEENLWIGTNSRKQGNLKLKNIDSLENLTQIGGNISITRNDALLNLKGLKGLSKLNSSLSIIINKNMQTFEGLDNITEINGDLQLKGNILKANKILHLNNLGSLKKITGLLAINSMHDLIDINGLKQLTYIGKGITLNQNPELKDISGFKNIRNNNDEFTVGINGCSKLLNLKGFENFTQLKSLTLNSTKFKNLNELSKVVKLKTLMLSYTSLESLHGLRNVDSINNYIVISHNKQLSQCGIKGICNILRSSPTHYIIFDNAKGCNETNVITDTSQIANACRTVSFSNIGNEILSVYPNPASNSLSIDLKSNKPISYKLISNNGKMLKAGVIRPHKPINIANFKRGVYFISLTVDNTIIIKRIIKI